jgi:hypothetical protein
LVRIELFGKTDCGRCESAKRKLNHYLEKWAATDRAEVVYHDMGSVDGLAEGAFKDVHEVPTLIVSAGAGELARWSRDMFDSKTLKGLLDNGEPAP